MSDKVNIMYLPSSFSTSAPPPSHAHGTTSWAQVLRDSSTSTAPGNANRAGHDASGANWNGVLSHGDDTHFFCVLHGKLI